MSHLCVNTLPASAAKRRSIYIYTTLAFLALLGAPYIYDISSLRVKVVFHKGFVLLYQNMHVYALRLQPAVRREGKEIL